jgi:hypothetical protein
MEANTDAILDAAHELRVRWRCNRCEVTGAGFSVYGQHAPQRQLESTTVAPGPNGVREAHGLRAAQHPDSGKRVRHEAFAQAGVDWTEH